MTASRYGR